MYNEIKKEVVELLKDKCTISWCQNLHLEDIFNKYDLYEDKKLYLDITTRLCLELSEQFEAYEIDSDIIFSTREIEYYLHLGKLIEYLEDKMFSREDLRKAVDSIGATFKGKPLSELPIEKLYEMLYNEDNELLRNSYFVIYGK